ncbi:DUF982 domain-containing protein (plasmid) [Ensifer sp. PDNC004]|nr:DUF982 domain-containing protein [Ensifer sp. PDNC004]
MLDMIWDQALVVLLPGMSRAMEIEDPRSAMFLLAEKWPVTHGREFQRALAFCAEAIEGKCPPSKARLAFLAAARRANVLIVDSGSPAASRKSPGDSLIYPSRPSTPNRLIAS